MAYPLVQYLDPIHSFYATLLSGVDTRLAGVTTCIIVIAAAASPVSIISYLPRAFFGSLLVLISIDLMVEWLWQARLRYACVSGEGGGGNSIIPLDFDFRSSRWRLAFSGDKVGYGLRRIYDNKDRPFPLPK